MKMKEEEIPGTPDSAGMATSEGKRLAAAERSRGKSDFSVAVTLVRCDSTAATLPEAGCSADYDHYSFSA